MVLHSCILPRSCEIYYGLAVNGDLKPMSYTLW